MNTFNSVDRIYKLYELFSINPRTSQEQSQEIYINPQANNVQKLGQNNVA